MSTLITQDQFKNNLTTHAGQFKSVLPDHIKPERFMRIAMTAVIEDPDLLLADQTTLMTSLVKCAKDGLIPDKKEAALVIFNTKNGNEWIKKVQYMPMVDGILKRARQSGQIDVIAARIVHENDAFDYWMDENGEHINFRPKYDGDRGEFKMVFAFAKLKSGELVVEPMTFTEIEKVRNASKGKDRGPWKDWYERMALKSALHRLARRLPNSSEMMEMMKHDESLYDFNGKPERNITPAASSISGLNDAMNAPPEPSSTINADVPLFSYAHVASDIAKASTGDDIALIESNIGYVKNEIHRGELIKQLDAKRQELEA